MANEKHHAWGQLVFGSAGVAALMLTTLQILGYIGGAVGESATYRQKMQGHVEGFQRSDQLLWAEIAKFDDLRDRFPVAEQKLETLDEQRLEDHREVTRLFDQTRSEIKEGRLEWREGLRDMLRTIEGLRQRP